MKTAGVKGWYSMAVDIAIDLGTSRTRIFLPRRGITADVPSVVAVGEEHEELLHFGEAAYRMIGRTPPPIRTICPLGNGVIAHFDWAAAMLAALLKETVSAKIRMPRVAVCVPVGLTDVEKRAVIDAVSRSGVRQVCLVEAPVAAALGTGIDIHTPHGTLVVDIGGGTTDMAVISLCDAAVSRSVRQAGQVMDEAIIQYIREQHHLLIGQRTAESVKQQIGCIVPDIRSGECCVKGKNLLTGMPGQVTVAAEEITAPLQTTAQAITGCIRELLEATPPELMADIEAEGIVLTGGSAQLPGFDRLIQQATGLSVRIAEQPDLCVINGCGRYLRFLRKAA